MKFRDRRGEEITAEEYERKMRDSLDMYKIVARSYDFPGDWMISTVCLGIDFYGLLYETCVFGPTGSEVIARYATELEAMEGHIELSKKLREELDRGEVPKLESS